MSSETPYQRTLAALADGTARTILAVLAALLAEHLPRREAVPLMAALVARANAHAVALVDVSLAATLTEVTSAPVAVLGLVPAADDLDRVARAVTTVLDDPEPNVTAETADEQREAVARRLERLARNEPLQAAGRAFNEAVNVSPHVTGYRRRLEPDACELCTWLAKGGYVYPADQPMHQHPGCVCHPEITTDPIGRNRA